MAAIHGREPSSSWNSRPLIPSAGPATPRTRRPGSGTDAAVTTREPSRRQAATTSAHAAPPGKCSGRPLAALGHIPEGGALKGEREAGRTLGGQLADELPAAARPNRHEVTLRGSSGYQARHPCRLIRRRDGRSSLSSAPTTASTDRVRLAGASRAATAVRTVANRRGPVVAADAASPPCFPARSGAKRGGVDTAVPRGVKLGDQLRPPDSERSLHRDGTRPALPLATTSARRATVPDRSRGDQRLPLMPARTASPPHSPA